MRANQGNGQEWKRGTRCRSLGCVSGFARLKARLVSGVHEDWGRRRDDLLLSGETGESTHGLWQDLSFHRLLLYPVLIDQSFHLTSEHETDSLPSLLPRHRHDCLPPVRKGRPSAASCQAKGHTQKECRRCSGWRHTHSHKSQLLPNGPFSPIYNFASCCSC